MSSDRYAALQDSYPYYLANEAVHANTDLAIIDKYTGEVATRVAMAGAEVVDEAIARSVEAFETLRTWPAFRHKAVLEHVVKRMQDRFDEMAIGLAVEAGKPLKDARGEVTRGIDTFTIAMEESTRQYGEMQPLDISPRAEGYRAMWRRVPIGPCSFISPFNFPINLAAHKIAPALAVGNPFILKPDDRTPIGALIIGDILSETDLPKGAFSILPCAVRDAAAFTEDERLKLLSFTGSPKVGYMLKAKAGKKPVVLELGGNAGCIVDADADLDDATNRIVHGAFYQSGQSCISVQRILVHADVYDAFRTMLADKVRSLKKGDPLDEDTFLGPMISENDAKRMEEWMGEATAKGATVLVGGTRDGAFFDATVLENAPHDVRVNCAEVFGPLATLEKFDDYDSALAIVNESPFGLQAGIFTRDIHRAFRAFDDLDVGGVVINDVPSMRVDSMPYGGVKDSGLGREGIRFAVEHMTEIRLMVLRNVG